MHIKRAVLKFAIMLFFLIPVVSAQQADISTYLQQLNHKDVPVRLYGAYALGVIGDEQAVQPLIKLLNDPDLYVRVAVIDALGEIGHSTTTKALQGLLEDENYLIRAHAAKALTKIVPESDQTHQIKRYTKDLSDPTRHVRLQAVSALTSLQPDLATVYRRRLAITDLTDADETIRANSAVALASIGNEQAVEPLSDILKDESSVVRRTAAIALRQIATRLGSTTIVAATQPLVDTLRDDDHQVRSHASHALVLIGPDVVQPLVSALMTSDGIANLAVINTLVQIGEPAVQPLTALLEADSATTRVVAVGVLGQIQPDKAQSYQIIRSLTDLKDQDASVRILALNRLGAIGHLPDSSGLVATLSDPDARVRRSAAITLGKIDQPPIGELILLLSDEDTSTRWHTMMAIGIIASQLETQEQLQSAINPLVNALTGSASSRLIAVDTLKRIGPSASDSIATLLTDEEAITRAVAATLLTEIEPMMAMTYQRTRYLADLQDTDATIRAAAIGPLARGGSPDTVELLVEVLKDKNRTVRQNAATALVQIGELAISALSTQLSDQTSNTRLNAVRILGEIAETLPDTTPMLPVVNMLIERLQDSDGAVRLAAINTLVKTDAPATDALIAQMGAPDSMVRSAATKALGQMGDTAMEALIKALSNPKSTVRQNAATALEQTIPDKARFYQVTRYINDLRDIDEAVRASAARMLGHIGDPRAFEQLVAALGDTDYRVRLHAAEALGRLNDKRAMPALDAAKKDRDHVKAVEEAAKNSFNWLKRLP